MDRIRYFAMGSAMALALGCVPEGNGSGAGDGGHGDTEPGDMDAGTEDGTVGRVCDDGDLIMCLCPDDSVGRRVCMDGAFPPCECPEPGPSHPYVIIEDHAFSTDPNGVAGGDFCGLTAECDGVVLTGIDSVLSLGSGLVCDGTTMEPPCTSGLNRQNPAAILDSGEVCNPSENRTEPSHYVSLGVGGEIAVLFERDLQGCTLDVVESAGNADEGYEVYVCQTDTIADDTCLLMGMPLGETVSGGRLRVDVP